MMRTELIRSIAVTAPSRLHFGMFSLGTARTRGDTEE